MRKTLSGVTVKDETLGQVTAVFATFNVIDKDGDLTLPGAIKDGTEVVISAYGHSSHGDKLPVGKGVIRTTDTEAILEGQFFLNTTAGKETFEVVKELGPLGEWSYSLSDVTRTSVESDGRYYWIIEQVGLVKEVSPVLMGAGIDTRTLATKGLGMKFSEEGDAVLAAVDAYLDRAREVMVLRSEKGRGLSDDTTQLLTRVGVSLKSLNDLLTPTEPSDGEVPEDIKAMAAARIQADLFSNLNSEKE